ncbi:Zinc knuckle family protein, putative isoform [Thalictrum thalictroides]|uniref:Zinc knuckle family protein, putative isoform n=1 Tax=Thalictrum thalictroides TaxID=46969 RepID=A0A7J6VCE5_THATH|nr:Zinc knuckle family protein, putative isoform [Thalictrum thalictroides]
MDTTTLDKSGNGSPVGQIIPYNSNIDCKEGPTTEPGLALNSPIEGIQPGQNNDSGAGANAASREEMVFVTTDPLSELVWSPHKGLSLKCADCNLADKKAFLWSMVVSPPKSITIGENKNLEPLAGENLNSSQMVSHSNCQVSEQVSVVRSTRSVMPLRQTKVHEHNLGEDMTDLTKKAEQPLLKINHEHSNKKGNKMCDPTEIQLNEISRTRRTMVSSSSEKASSQGNENEGDTGSSSMKLNEGKLNSVGANPEPETSEKVTSSDPYERSTAAGSGNSYTAGMVCDLAYKASTSKQCKLPDSAIQVLTSAYNRCEGLDSVIQKEHMEKITAASLKVLLEKEDSTSENDFEPQKAESAFVEMGIISYPADEVKQGECQNEVIPEGDVVLEASPKNIRFPSYQKKDKEKIPTNAEVNAGILENDDDSHESVESCNNSRGLVLAEKRPWSFDQHLMIGNKKIKQTDESPHCMSVQKHGSSFMNWISNMVKGSSKSDLKETTSLDLVIRHSNHEYGNEDQQIMLQKRNKPSGCTSTGFGNVFKALYCSDMNPTTGISNIDHQAGKGSKELELDNMKCEDSSIHSTCGMEHDKLCKEVVCPTANPAICDDEGGPSSLPRIPSSNIVVVQENLEVGAAENNNLLSMPSDPGKGGQISPSSSFQKGLDSPFNEKEIHKVRVSAPLKSSNSMMNRSSLGSLWITRFCPKVSGTIDSSQCDQNAHKSSKAMASIFARRLDALKHIIPSEMNSNATITCIFCGIIGHKLQECSEITEFELHALLKKVDLYDGAEQSSCLCIRCFQLNHWAIACPNISSRKRSHSDGSSFLLNFRKFRKTLDTPRSIEITDNEKDSPKNMVFASTVSGGKKRRVDNELRARTDVNKNVNGVTIFSKSYSDSKLIKKNLLVNRCCEGNSLKNTSREITFTGKQTKTSSSTENVSKEYQFKAFYNFVDRQIPAIPRGTFESIKKLRLSRTDIFKWRRSPVSLVPLEGFFIRLRLRKWDKELGSTGYYVARINGGLREKSSGNSKVPLSVRIVGFKCLAEIRFVSNHDFLEDELLAWWCATLKSGGNLPSEKDLEVKLKQRKCSGF